jgi:hypothetical protein
LGRGVNAECDGVVRGGLLGWICGCHGLEDRGTPRRSTTSCHVTFSESYHETWWGKCWWIHPT